MIEPTGTTPGHHILSMSNSCDARTSRSRTSGLIRVHGTRRNSVRWMIGGARSRSICPGTWNLPDRINCLDGTAPSHSPAPTRARQSIPATDTHSTRHDWHHQVTGRKILPPYYSITLRPRHMQRKTACPLYPRKRTLVEPVICRNACARTKATDPPIDLDGSLDLGQFWIAPLSGKTQSRLQPSD